MNLSELFNTLLSALNNQIFRSSFSSLLISLSVFLVLYGVYREYDHRQVQERLNKLVDSSQIPIHTLEMSQSFAERVLKPIGRALLAKLGRYTPSGNLEVIRQQLTMAGNPGNLAVIDFLGLKMVSAIVTGILASIYLISSQNMSGLIAISLGIGAGIVGLYLPNYWLQRRIRQRKVEIGKALPNALDILTTMVDAGLGFDLALLRLCDKWDNPLTQEFERMANEMNMGVRRAEALRHLTERVDVPELRTFGAVLIQADQLGISIANVLHSQSEQIRQRRRQWVEETASKMPLKMMPVIVFFIFPALFAVLLGPAIPGMIAAFGGG